MLLHLVKNISNQAMSRYRKVLLTTIASSFPLGVPAITSYIWSPNNAGVGVSTPTSPSWKFLFEILFPQRLTTNSLLTKSLTNNMNNRLIYILYVICSTHGENAQEQRKITFYCNTLDVLSEHSHLSSLQQQQEVAQKY